MDLFDDAGEVIPWSDVFGLVGFWPGKCVPNYGSCFDSDEDFVWVGEFGDGDISVELEGGRRGGVGRAVGLGRGRGWMEADCFRFEDVFDGQTSGG